MTAPAILPGKHAARKSTKRFDLYGQHLETSVNLERFNEISEKLKLPDSRDSNPQIRERIISAAGQHDRFIELIEAGDEEGAVALTLDHWALSRDHLEMFVRPDPLPINVPISA